MAPDKIYLDNNILVRYFLKRLYPDKYKSDPEIVKFLNEHMEIERYVSIISVAELVHTLIHTDEFRRFHINLERVWELFEELRSMIGFKVIEKDEFGGVMVEGVVISKNIIKYVSLHQHLDDCIHLDIARQHDLWFVTHEKEMGKLKEIYDKIITDDKLMRQFKA